MASISSAEIVEYWDRINKATTRSELEQIKAELLTYYDESDPDVKELVLKMSL